MSLFSRFPSHAAPLAAGFRLLFLRERQPVYQSGGFKLHRDPDICHFRTVKSSAARLPVRILILRRQGEKYR